VRYILAICMLLCAANIQAEENRAMLIFSAKWCGPCQRMKNEVFPLLRNEMRPWKVYRVDIDTHKEVTRKWKVDGVPTIIFVKLVPNNHAVPIRREVGFKSVRYLRQLLKDLLK